MRPFKVWKVSSFQDSFVLFLMYIARAIAGSVLGKATTMIIEYNSVLLHVARTMK